MAHCDEYLELISAAVDGALSPADQEKLNAHLAACPGCRALLADLTAIHEGLSALPNAEPPAGLHDRIMSAVAADNVLPFTPKKKARPWKKWGAWAAAVALIFAGAWGVQDSVFPGGHKSAEAALGAAPAAAEGRAADAPESVADTADLGLPANGENGLSIQREAVTSGAEESVQSRSAVPGTADAYGGDSIVLGQSLDEAQEEAPARGETVPAGETFAATSNGPTEENADGEDGMLKFFAVPRPAETADGSTSAPNTFLATGGAPESAEKAELTAREALDILLDEYPMREDAELVDTEEFLGWQTPLLPVGSDDDPDGQQVSTRLEYLRVTPNGKYHEFRLYSFLLDIPSEGLAHSSTLNFFAVPLDGGEILVERQDYDGGLDSPGWEAYLAGIDTYQEAITN